MNDQETPDADRPPRPPWEFDRFSGEATEGYGFGLPIGNQNISAVWVGNNLFEAWTTIRNARASIEYAYNGVSEFTLHDVLWRGQHSVVTIRPDRWDFFPVFMIPDSAHPTMEDVQSALINEGGEKICKPLKFGKWTARITVTADSQPTLHGEIGFTVYEEDFGWRPTVRCTGKFGDVRLPSDPDPTGSERQQGVSPATHSTPPRGAANETSSSPRPALEGTRKERLTRFQTQNPGVTLADIKFSANVHTPDFQDWRNNKMRDKSVMAERIEDVLSGARPLQKKPRKKQAD